MTEARAPALLVAALLGAAAPAHAGREETRLGTTYTAVNPLAALAGSFQSPTVYFLPVLTGHEYGLAVSQGLFVARHTAVEVRFSFGEPTKLSAYTQLHAGFLFFLLDCLRLTDKGLYGGVFVKVADNYQRQTDIHTFNLLPYLALGYWLQITDFFVDLRIEQTAVVFTFSTAAHTGVGVFPMFSPVPGFSPVLPAVVVNVGFLF